MYFSAHFETKKYGYVSFALPTVKRIINKSNKIQDKFFMYVSPNGTPWAATYVVGPKFSTYEKRLAKQRKRFLGHNFNSEDEKNYKRLQQINNGLNLRFKLS